ncbi:MAG: threonylcarbamoyl-AMP synthase [Firmicutes bacterium]|nr:threonylcarbamoyl-AMP synthase [Bacillota bacterium]
MNELVDILLNDGVISVPTDTVYGLCTMITSSKGYNKLIDIKNRPSNKEFPIMCSDYNQIESIADINELAKKIIDNFMPGPITIILKKKDTIKINGINSDTVAIRLAPTKEIKYLIEKTNTPLFMTSANISGNRECKSIEEIKNTFNSLDGILEGNVSFKISSTIIDCTSNDIKILREGPISLKEIEDSLKI